MVTSVLSMTAYCDGLELVTSCSRADRWPQYSEEQQVARGFVLVYGPRKSESMSLVTASGI